MAYVKPFLELKTLPRFSPVSMGKLKQSGQNLAEFSSLDLGVFVFAM